jgi:Fe-S-cluster containining protein
MPESPDFQSDDDFPDLAANAVPEGHDSDDDGEHDPDACYACLLARPPVESNCRCGKCCQLIVEVTAQDAEREPLIKERGSSIVADARYTESGQPDIIGYMLNSKDNDYACTFLDRPSGLCGIYPTRPLVCRLFDCDGEGRDQMVELGMERIEVGEPDGDDILTA